MVDDGVVYVPAVTPVLRPVPAPVTVVLTVYVYWAPGVRPVTTAWQIAGEM